MEEDDDPVIHEIPVFLSNALAKHLHILQYPVRPAKKDWSSSNVIDASFKPKNEMFKLDVALDTHSDKYCPSKGEQIAINTDGPQEPWKSREKDKEKEKNKYFKYGIMDKIVHESSVPCTKTSRYAIAQVHGNEVHMTPVQGIVQLRPTCSYHDKQDKMKTEKNKAEEEDVEEEPQAQQITVKFARQETELAKKLKAKSFDTMSQRISEEPWYAGYWRNDPDIVELERLKLFCAHTNDECSLGLARDKYLADLVPAPDDDKMVPEKKASLQDQIKELLHNAKLLTFNEIRSRLRVAEGEESALLALLAGVACCVRGLWTARSDTAPARRAAARDHLLYLFTQHKYIDRHKVTVAVRLPPQEVLDIIKSVAKYNPNMGWELLIPPDTAFEEKYPEIIQRQNLYWEAKERAFKEALVADIVPKRQRKKSQRDSIGSDSMMSPKQRCNSVSEEDSDKKRGKNKAASGSGKRTRNASVSNTTEK